MEEAYIGGRWSVSGRSSPKQTVQRVGRSRFQMQGVGRKSTGAAVVCTVDRAQQMIDKAAEKVPQMKCMAIGTPHRQKRMKADREKSAAQPGNAVLSVLFRSAEAALPKHSLASRGSYTISVPCECQWTPESLRPASRACICNLAACSRIRPSGSSAYSISSRQTPLA